MPQPKTRAAAARGRKALGAETPDICRKSYVPCRFRQARRPRSVVDTAPGPWKTGDMKRLARLVFSCGFLAACGGSAPSTAKSPEPAASAAPAATVAAKPVEAKPAEPAPVTLPTEGSDTRLKGSRLQMWLPVGMKRPTRMPALRFPEPRLVVSSVEFTVDPEGVEQFLKGANEGAELSDGHPYVKGKLHGFVGHAQVEDPSKRQQILGVASGNAAAIITVQYAAVAEPLANKILDSVVLFENEPLDALALYGMSVGDKAGLELSTRVSTPLLTEPGVKPPLNGAAGLVIMSVPYPKPNLTDEELGQLLGGSLNRYVPNMEKAKEEELKIGSCPAYSITAPGLDNGKPTVIYGVIARCPDSALLVTGTLRPSDEKKILPRFQKVVRSLSFDDSIFAPVAATPQPTSQKLP